MCKRLHRNNENPFGVLEMRISLFILFLPFYALYYAVEWLFIVDK